jgi:hypothetical protein
VRKGNANKTLPIRNNNGQRQSIFWNDTSIVCTDDWESGLGVLDFFNRYNIMIGFLLNIFFVWFCWELANDHFEKGNNFAGWLGIAISATNAASVASALF